MRFNFGKYKGLDISDQNIPIGYLKWAIEKCENINQWLKDAIEEEIIEREKPIVWNDCDRNIGDGLKVYVVGSVYDLKLPFHYKGHLITDHSQIEYYDSDQYALDKLFEKFQSRSKTFQQF